MTPVFDKTTVFIAHFWLKSNFICPYTSSFSHTPIRIFAVIPLVQRDPSTSGWRRPPALVRWMAVVCRSDWAAALPAHPTGSTRWTGSGYHVVIASTAAELACSAARWRGAGAPVTEKASSEAGLWLTALGRGVYCVRAGPLRTGSPIFAVWMLTALCFLRVFLLHKVL